MSRRAWKEARRHVRDTVRAVDARKRAGKRAPWLYVQLLGVGITGPLRRWNARWEKRHAERLAITYKKLAHQRMRPGAQPLPRR